LELAEERLKEAITPFLCTIFSAFHEQKELWQQALNVVSELDCLTSLAIVSGSQEGVMSRPKFIPYEGDNKDSAFLDLRGMRHPCVTLTNNSSFIPNDTFISTKDS